MAEFNPSPHDRITIGGQTYEVMPHPSVPSFAFGQEGRKAFVYQVRRVADDAMLALKKFKQVYRVPELVDVCASLARFSNFSGLEAANRVCLNRNDHADALDQYPDLEFAVLMPWIIGSTWYDIVIGMTPLSKRESMAFANGAARVLDGFEEAGLAHCDIAAPNVIVNPNTGSAHLIDIEDLYAPGFVPPAALPAGTDGYAHKTAIAGLWGPTADRFAGAILMAEMAAWHLPEIRKHADEEHFFNARQMQEDTAEYRLMVGALASLDTQLAELFELAWFSPAIEDCPPMRAWHAVMEEVYHRVRLEEVVSDWKPLIVPSGLPTADEHQPPEPGRPSEPAPSLLPDQAAEAEMVTPEKQPPVPHIPIASPPAISTPMPPPAAAAPVPIASAIPGGPVVEWRPLIMPAPAAAARPANGSDSSPIALPDQPYEPDQAETVNKPLYVPPLEQGAWDEPAFDPLDVPYTPSLSETGQHPRSYNLLRPLLDLSHVDARHRPLLVWSETPGATAYLLQEAKDSTFADVREFRFKAGDTRWRPTWGRSSKLSYRIKALGDDNRESEWSDPLTIRIGDG